MGGGGEGGGGGGGGGGGEYMIGVFNRCWYVCTHACTGNEYNGNARIVQCTVSC